MVVQQPEEVKWPPNTHNNPSILETDASNPDVSGRQASSRQLSRGSQGAFQPLSEADHFLGIHHQNCPGTNTDIRISGVYHQLDRDDSISLSGEIKQLDHQMQETTFQSTDNTEKPVSRDWADDVSNISCTPSPLHYRKLQFQKNEALAHHHS